MNLFSTNYPMYDALSQTYDRFVDWNSRLAYELPFLEQILDSLPSRAGEKTAVLDVACGTGMHAIALAQRGYRAVGSDVSQSMIHQARENARQAGVEVRFEVAGFGEQTAQFGEESFDAVFCLGNSLPHLLNETEVLNALKDFYRLLRPQGVVLIQNRNFDRVLQTLQREQEPQSFRQGEQEWIFIRFYDFLEDGLIRFNFLTLFRRGDQDWQQDWQSSLLKPLLATDLSCWIEQAGFSVLRLFGSLAGDAFDATTSPNLVLLAQKS